MKRTFVLAVALLASGSAAASNFSYTYLEGSLGRMSLDEGQVFNGDVYDEFGYASIGGAYQLANDLVLGVQVEAATNDGPNSEVTLSGSLLFASVPMALSDSTDLVLSLGLASTELEICDASGNACNKGDDSSMAFGIGARMWISPDLLEINFGWSDTTDSDSDSMISLGAAWWPAAHHSIRLDAGFTDNANLTTLGYRYSW